jgi:Zn-dependent protease
MPFLPFSHAGLNLNVPLLDINVAQIFIAFIVLLFSLTVHETAHAWTADRLGDPTARMLGRVSLNPLVHADLVGTVLFPLLAMIGGVPLIGWAKPVPVDVRRLGHPRRDHVLVAAAGPASNLGLAILASIALVVLPVKPVTLDEVNVTVPLAGLLSRAVQLNVLLAIFNMLPIPPLDGGNVLMGILPPSLAARVDRLRPYGFLLIYALMFTGGFDVLVGGPYRLVRAWLP